jgi:hypothetical protein
MNTPKNIFNLNNYIPEKGKCQKPGFLPGYIFYIKVFAALPIKK